MAWETYQAEIDGAQALVAVDMQAGADLAHTDLPNLLRVELAPHELHGAPDAACAEALERELDEWFTALGGRMVACVRSGQRIVWFIYVACGWLEAANLVHRIGLRRALVLGAEMQGDARHRVYDALLPTAAELRHARNARLLQRLAEEGMAAGDSCVLQHVLRFANHTQALAFSRLARGHGFHVEALLPPHVPGERYTLKLARPTQLTIDAIDADTRLLQTEAQRLGGLYEGWQPAAALAQPA